MPRCQLISMSLPNKHFISVRVQLVKMSADSSSNIQHLFIFYCHFLSLHFPISSCPLYITVSASHMSLHNSCHAVTLSVTFCYKINKKIYYHTFCTFHSYIYKRHQQKVYLQTVKGVATGKNSKACSRTPHLVPFSHNCSPLLAHVMSLQRSETSDKTCG